MRLFSRVVFAVVCRLGRLLERGTEVLHERQHVRAAEGRRALWTLPRLCRVANRVLPFSCFSCEILKSCDVLQDSSYANSWSWFLKPRAQAKEKKLLENFHAAGFPLPKGFKGK